MPKLPLINAKQLNRILEKEGFICLRQKGSHLFWKHGDGRSTVVPFHAGENIDRGLLIKIIKQDLKISREKFINYL